MAKPVVKEISTGYVPRPLQAEIHNSLKRFNVLVLHRRFGKTILALNEMIDRAVRCDLQNPRYAYIAPLYSQAKRIAWDYLKHYTQNIPGVKVNEAELRVDIPRPARGDTIRMSLYGAENPAALRGIYLDGGILDEFAEMVPSVFSEVIRPALSDRKGWVIFISTPKGANHFYQLYRQAESQPDWYTKTIPASVSGHVSEEELAAARLVMTADEYAQEYECSFSAGIVGAYYSRQLEEAEAKKRITGVPHQPDFEVHTYWDLGIGDTTVVWFVQHVGREFHFIDHWEGNGVSLDEIVRQVRSKPYQLGEAVLPWDAMARELGTGRTRVETLQNLGLKRIRVLKRQGVDDGINAVRMVFSQCYFDKVKCARGIEALKAYQRKWDEKNQIYSSAPLHNWASNSADAMRYFALGVRKDYSNMESLPRMADSDYNPFGERRYT